MKRLNRVVIVVLLAITCQANAGPGIEVGQPFPELLLPTADTGEPKSLDDYRGQKLILHIFASW